jgi:hypothetical protein
MSKSIFNSDVFNSKNVSNSNDLPDINITDLICNTATIGTITNTELQAATTGVANNGTNLTGITYATSGDLTTIDNNVSVTGTITNTELQAATTKLTGITYATSGDLTTIDNNVSVTGTITNTELQAATTKLTGITYVTSGDLTTIDNNVSVTGAITNTELQAATTALTGITYASSGDITTIANNLTIDTGKVLAIPNYTNVETTLTSLSNQQATNTSDITALEDVAFRFVIDPATTIKVNGNDFNVGAGHFYHTPRMVRYNFDKDAATNNLWGGDNVANDIRQTRQTGTSFVSSTGSGIITVSVAGFYRIKYQATVENDGQNGRITVGAYLRHGTTLYWKDDDRGFFGAAYIRDDGEGTMGSINFEDYLDLAANDQLMFPTKLNLGTNTGFTDTTAQANLDWFSMVELELIKLA